MTNWELVILWSLDICFGICFVSMMILVRSSLSGRRWLGVGLQVGIDVFGDDEAAPHELPVAGEGAEVFVVAFGFGGGELEGFLLAGFVKLGCAQDVAALGDVG